MPFGLVALGVISVQFIIPMILAIFSFVHPRAVGTSLFASESMKEAALAFLIFFILAVLGYLVVKKCLLVVSKSSIGQTFEFLKSQEKSLFERLLCSTNYEFFVVSLFGMIAICLIFLEVWYQISSNSAVFRALELSYVLVPLMLYIGFRKFGRNNLAVIASGCFILLLSLVTESRMVLIFPIVVLFYLFLDFFHTEQRDIKKAKLIYWAAIAFLFIVFWVVFLGYFRNNFEGFQNFNLESSYKPVIKRFNYFAVLSNSIYYQYDLNKFNWFHLQLTSICPSSICTNKVELLPDRDFFPCVVGLVDFDECGTSTVGMHWISEYYLLWGISFRFYVSALIFGAMLSGMDFLFKRAPIILIPMFLVILYRVLLMDSHLFLLGSIVVVVGTYLPIIFIIHYIRRIWLCLN